MKFSVLGDFLLSECGLCCRCSEEYFTLIYRTIDHQNVGKTSLPYDNRRSK